MSWFTGKCDGAQARVIARYNAALVREANASAPEPELDEMEVGS